MVIRFDAQLPHLATREKRGELRAEMHREIGGLRAELGEKPSKAYLWRIMTALIAAYGCGLAALAVQR
jgi:hypothetical protein